MSGTGPQLSEEEDPCNEIQLRVSLRPCQLDTNEADEIRPGEESFSRFSLHGNSQRMTVDHQREEGEVEEEEFVGRVSTHMTEAAGEESSPIRGTEEVRLSQLEDWEEEEVGRQSMVNVEVPESRPEPEDMRDSFLSMRQTYVEKQCKGCELLQLEL